MITPEIAESIYAILVKVVGAPDDEIARWGFCHNMTYSFPGSSFPYTFNSKMAGKNFPSEKILRIHDGDPLYLKIDDPEEWQLMPVRRANVLIAKLFEKEKTNVQRGRRKRVATEQTRSNANALV